ncbi:MAG: SDR family oxidoreductase [Hyphomicrobiaceae bacterium]
MNQQTGRSRAALVTGASRRIGKAIALDLARNGWDICVHYHASASEAAQVVAEIEAAGRRAVALRADLAETDALPALMAQAVAALGPVSSLINNASTFIDDELSTLDPQTWDQQVAVNLKAPVFLAKAFAGQLPPGIGGNVINIIDQRVLQPLPGLLSYAITKEGLFGATRLLAQALAPRIRVNAIGPGPVLRNVRQTEQAFTAEAHATLLGKSVTPDEIAQAIRFILDAPSMTGQMIAIDAGQHLSRTVIQD